MGEWTPIIVALLTGGLAQWILGELATKWSEYRADKADKETRRQRKERELHEWQETAYATRAVALKAGVSQEDLPPLPGST